MIVLTYGPAWQSIDLSPFCVKLQTWLRLAGLPFTSEIGDVRRMPQRKLPVLQLDDGQRLADSRLVIEMLRQRHRDPLGDEQRSPAERALMHGAEALLEHDAYFASLWWRWMDEANFQRLKPVLRGYIAHFGVPGIAAPFLMAMVRRQMRTQLDAQGTGRHSSAAIGRIGVDALAAVGDLLAHRPYLLGNTPCSADATAFAMLHVTLNSPMVSPMQRFVAQHQGLQAYHQRLLRRCWPERLEGQAT